MAYAMPVQSDPTNVMGRRVVAYLLDFVLASGVFVAVMALTKTASYVGAPSGACDVLRATQDVRQCAQFGSHVYTWKGGAAAEAYALTALVSFLNNVLLQGLGGASIGKLILGLRVVDAQGETCGIGRAFVRWLLLLVDLICGIVGLITASVTHPHRRIGDMAAGTYVIGLANVGRPIVAAPPAYQYAYPQGGTPEWTPPGTVPPPAPGWGAAPPPAWGTPPPGQTPASSPPPAWGAPPPPSAPWGAPPPAADPGPPASAWGAPAPAAPVPAEPPDRSGWGTPPSTWGAPETPAPTPPPPAPQWSAPPPPPPPEPQSGWGQPAAAAPEPAPTPAPEPPAPAAPAAPTVPAAPPEQQAAPPAAPAASPPPAGGESWWSKAFDAEDENEK